MKTFFLSFPRLSVSLTVSHEIVADIESTFSHSISPARELPSRHKYEIKATSHGFVCLKDNQLVGKFGSSLETLCILEEDIEVSLTRHMGDWVAFHAGAVAAPAGGRSLRKPSRDDNSNIAMPWGSRRRADISQPRQANRPGRNLAMSTP